MPRHCDGERSAAGSDPEIGSTTPASGSLWPPRDDAVVRQNFRRGVLAGAFRQPLFATHSPAAAAPDASSAVLDNASRSRAMRNPRAGERASATPWLFPQAACLRTPRRQRKRRGRRDRRNLHRLRKARVPRPAAPARNLDASSPRPIPADSQAADARPMRSASSRRAVSIQRLRGRRTFETPPRPAGPSSFRPGSVALPRVRHVLPLGLAQKPVAAARTL